MAVYGLDTTIHAPTMNGIPMRYMIAIAGCAYFEPAHGIEMETSLLYSTVTDFARFRG